MPTRQEHGHFTDILHQNAAMAPGGKTGSLLISIAYLVGAVGIEIEVHFHKS
jgi:hypothetical protein